MKALRNEESESACGGCDERVCEPRNSLRAGVGPRERQ